MAPPPGRGRRDRSAFGVYPAIVTDIVDPDDRGRVRVSLPDPAVGADGDLGIWATLCTPYAGEDQGLVIVPEVGTQVVVAFEGGDVGRAYVVGSIWTGRLPLPQAPDGTNDIRLLRTRSDSRLEFDDAPAGPKISMTTHSGHQVVLDAGTSEVTITHSSGSSIRLTASGAVEITANSAVKVRAPAVTVDAPIATLSGVVSCETLIAGQGVVSPSYTPGVGNLQ